MFSHKLAEYFDLLQKKASEMNESSRFYSLELPLFNVLVTSACKGIKISKEIVKAHKSELKYQYYREIKSFAEKHNVLYEIPRDGEIKSKLSELGYDVENYALDFLIDFLPSKDGYTEDLRGLQKVNKSYRVFNGIASAESRIYPIVETHWTSTARIYHKSPSIQNISKRYRDIFIADDGLCHSYVDYDQFEVGIMAALSGDEKMKNIYENTDAYKDFSLHVFNTEDYRKKSKVIFLSYTYGMSLSNILSSVQQLGGDTGKAQEYFEEFGEYENWKNTLYDEYVEKKRIPTIRANYLNRNIDGELSSKEQRMVVSHVVQGTGSYIFKKAIYDLSKEANVELLIPMHDAILFQHPSDYDTNRAVKIFESNMTDILEKKVKGKASLEDFYST